MFTSSGTSCLELNHHCQQKSSVLDCLLSNMKVAVWVVTYWTSHNDVGSELWHFFIQIDLQWFNTSKQEPTFNSPKGYLSICVWNEELSFCLVNIGSAWCLMLCQKPIQWRIKKTKRCWVTIEGNDLCSPQHPLQHLRIINYPSITSCAFVFSLTQPPPYTSPPPLLSFPCASGNPGSDDTANTAINNCGATALILDTVMSLAPKKI